MLKLITKSWQHWSAMGLHPGLNAMDRKYARLGNRVSMLLLPLVTACAIYYIALEMYVSARFVGAIGLVCGLALLGSRFVGTRTSRLVLIAGTGGIAWMGLTVENQEVGSIIAYSMISLGHVTVPLILLNVNKERALLFAFLLFDLVSLLTIDTLLLHITEGLDVASFNGHYYSLFKVPQVVVWLILVSGFVFLKRANARIESELQASKQEVEKQQKEIEKRNQHLKNTNQAMKDKMTELRQKHKRLIIQQDEIWEQGKKLKQNEQRLSQFLDQIPAGIFIVNADGSPHYQNKAALNLLGDDALQQQNFEELIHQLHATRAGTGLPYPIEQLPLWLALNQAQRHTVEDVEVRKGLARVPLQVTAPL